MAAPPALHVRRGGVPPVSPGLPILRPVPASRRDEVDAHGHRIKRIESSDGRCFQVIRSLCDALMGKVEAAVELSHSSSGWVLPPPPYRYVAIKQLYKHCITHGVTVDGKPVKENPMQEIAVMTLLGIPGHVNVMRLLHFLEDTERLYIVLEFLDGGELFKQVSDHGTVPEEAARRYMWQVVLGTRYMHARGIAHRDISLENAMMSSSPIPETVKLIDFGLSIPIPMDGNKIVPDARVGKEKYMPPEVFAMQAYDPVKVDIWTLGISVFVLLFGIYPYQIPSTTHCRYFAQVAAGGLLPMLKSWRYDERVTPAALDFIDSILKVNPAERPSLEQLILHEWFAPIRNSLPPGALELHGLPPPLSISLGPVAAPAPPGAAAVSTSGQLGSSDVDMDGSSQLRPV